MNLQRGLIRSCRLFRSRFSTNESFESTTSTNNNKKTTVTIFGGNGFVGQAIARSLLEQYSSTCHVISISRSGQPRYGPLAGHSGKNVLWLKGDVEDGSTYRDILKQSNCVISCIGAFGSNEFMEKVLLLLLYLLLYLLSCVFMSVLQVR